MRGRAELTALEDSDHKSGEPQPLLSVIVPVYNGSGKLERAIGNIQSRMEQLEEVVWNVEAERYGIEREMLTPKAVAVGSSDVPPPVQKLLMYAGGTVESQDAGPEVKIDPQYSGERVKTGLPWYEIIVVNDGSKDNTRSVIDKICSNDVRVRSISYSVNMGKGYAIKQGVLHSKGRYVLFMDGDGDISADVLAKYLQRLSKVHIVIGSKIHRRSVVHAPASRKFLSRCFQFYVKKALGLKVHDTQVGLKAGRGEAFRKIFEKVQVKRYAFDAEMLAIAGLLDLKVAELPVKIELDKSFKAQEIARMAVDVLAVAFRLKIVKWYQKNMERKRPQFRLSLLF